MVLFAPLKRLVLTRFRWFFATGDQRDAEILALRHQVLVLQRQINRTQFSETDRTILALLATVFDRRRLAEVFLIVRPATVIGWAPAARRPPLDPTTHSDSRTAAHRPRAPTVDPAGPGENSDWGYRRIHGELCRLGHRVAPSTVWKTLKSAGIEPTRDRTGPTWAEFIRSQAAGIVATDFACVDTATLRQVPRPVRHRRALLRCSIGWRGQAGLGAGQSDR